MEKQSSQNPGIFLNFKRQFRRLQRGQLSKQVATFETTE